MFISPMLLETASGPFSHDNYIFEPKIDGHRLLFSREGGQIRLYTRHETDCIRQYPELLTPFNDDILLDGEVACTDPETVHSFTGSQSRLSYWKTAIISHR